MNSYKPKLTSVLILWNFVTNINCKLIFISDNLGSFNIEQILNDIMKDKKPKKSEEKTEWEHEQAKEELHQAELAEGYEQDDKYEESED